ncbi:cell wall binding repeat-containing protein [Clostridium sp. DL-VIII]|uniref:N-acetylmuramoyl-L-alanine amidase family protein n=1 Tax=Clostridium sp. DL-VIII TaxID=641107 RepID=UPI00023AFF06|nr:N-acetylmuramoyl-L-alanine amidase family protein [Clostridium sp. DL-VIII]EHI99081.1 cell wall binding repeat-containing protein [Clostridium sp. DL-VIII]
MLGKIFKRNKTKAIAIALVLSSLLNSIPFAAVNAATATATASVSSFDPTSFLTESGWIMNSDGISSYKPTDQLGTSASTGAWLYVNGAQMPIINTGMGVYGSVVTAPEGSNIYMEFDAVSESTGTYEGYYKTYSRRIITVDNAEQTLDLYYKGSRHDGNDVYVYIVPTPVGSADTPDTAASNAQQTLLNTKIDNSTTLAQLQALVQSSVDISKYSVSLSQTNRVAATESSDGVFAGNLTVTSMSNGEQSTTSFTLPISKLAQSLSTISTTLSNFIKSYSAVNSSTANDFKTAVAITNPSYNITVGNWSLTPATDTNTGSLSCNVYINEGSTVRQTFAVSKTVDKLPTTSATASILISNLVSNYTATNASDKTAFLTSCKNAVAGNITVTIPTWTLTKASETSKGSLVGTINVSDGTTNQIVTINKIINYLDESIATAQLNVENAMNSLAANNYIAEDEVLNIAKSAINTNYFDVSISDFQNINSTETILGKITGTITIKDKSDSAITRTVPLDKTIPILVQTLDNAKTVVTELLNNYSVNNTTTEEQVLSAVNKAINTNYITATLESFDLRKSSETNEGNANITIRLADNSGNSEDITKNYTIGVQKQSVATIKSLYEKALENIQISNNTTKDDILDNVLVTNQSIKVTMNDFSKTDSTETKSGIITGTINITDGNITEAVPVKLKIAQLKESVDTVAAFFTSKLKTFVATNEVTEDDIKSLVYTRSNEDISVDIKDFSVLQANDTEEGKVTGTVEISDGINTRYVEIDKTIQLLSQDLSTSTRLVQNILNTYAASNSTTFDEILRACNEVVTNSNIDIYYKTDGELKKVDSDEFNAGYMNGTVIIADGSATIELPFNIIIKKTDQTLLGAKTLITETLNNFKPTNATVEQDVINAVETNIRSSNINVMFGANEEKFNKTLATEFSKGLISGAINVSDEIDIFKIPVNLIISQLPQTIDQVAQGIEVALPNFVVTNDTTPDDIKKQIEDVCAANMIVAIKEFNKTVSTLESAGNIQITVILVDKNTGSTKEILFNLTIPQLQQTLDEAKNTVIEVLPTLPVSNDTTKDDLQNQLQDKVGDNITIIIGDGDFGKTPATTTTSGEITGVVTIIDNNTGKQTTIPIDLIIGKLVAKPSSGGGGGGSSSDKDKSSSIQDQTGNIKNGAGTCEWKNENGSWHYYTNGVIQIGWVQIERLWYYFNVDGTLQIGWLYENGNWYYLNPNPDDHLGAMETGWLSYDGAYFYLNSTGAMARGWQTIDENWYYFQSNGAMRTGWLEDTDGSWYYLEESGVMETNWFYDKGKWYYLNNSGSMATGWFKDTNDNWYYADQSGAMLKSTIVDGYNLDDQGRLI